jgi:hypothetical protein
MIFKFAEVDKDKDRKQDGVFGGQGKWRVLLVTLKGKEKSASFLLGINDDTKEIDIQPVHPSDRKMLITTLDKVFSYKSNRD